MDIQRVTFSSGDITLEGVLRIPEGAGGFPGVVVCHPHPLYGGDMDSSVVTGIATALVKRQMVAMTFNFRGVGSSQGTHDRGVGEVADALAALEYLEHHGSVDAARLGIAGYSFGAGIALNATESSNEVRAVASVACPATPLNDLDLHQINRPKLFIMGDIDHGLEPDQFKFLVSRFKQSREVEVLPGADHFLGGRETQVGDLVADFFTRTL
jgi:alpha/beta superfamily hydrolase